MSIQVTSWVFRHSPATLGRRLVLLVLADKANDDGTGCWPSVATIAEQARLSERAVQYALRQLEEDGQIVRAGYGPAGTINYTVVTDHGKFDDLPPLLNSTSSLDAVVGSLDGLGAIHDTIERADCTPAESAPPDLPPF